MGDKEDDDILRKTEMETLTGLWQHGGRAGAMLRGEDILEPSWPQEGPPTPEPHSRQQEAPLEGCFLCPMRFPSPVTWGGLKGPGRPNAVCRR